MRSISSKVCFLFTTLCVALACGAQAVQQVNPAVQIKWPAITGVGSPSAITWPCAPINYGQPYVDSTGGAMYVCASTGWVPVGAATMVYPATGIAVSTGVGWGTSYGIGNPIPGNMLTVFGAAGSSHSIGGVPDPGGTSGLGRFLKDDGTWAVPPGTGGGCTLPGVANALLSDSGSGTCTGSAAITTDSANNLSLTVGTYHGPRLSIYDNSGNCLGQEFCNLLGAEYYVRTTSNGTETDASIHDNPAFYGPGRNFGPIAGSDGGWTVTKDIVSERYFRVRGIAQGVSEENYFEKGGGDDAVRYVYNNFFSGCGIEPSAEGCTAETVHDQTLHATTTTLTGGTNTVPTLSFVSGEVPAAPDNGYLIDINSTQNISTALNGTASCCTYGEWSVPVTPHSLSSYISTAICSLTSALPDTHHTRTYQQSDTATVSCLYGTPTPGYAVIVTPHMSMSGMPEQVNITAGSSSSITANHALSHAVGSMLFEGGVAGRLMLFPGDRTRFGSPSTYFALGTTDGSTLSYCVVEFGNCNVALPRVGETAETTSSAVNLDVYAEVTSETGGYGLGVTVEPNPWFATSAVSNGDTVLAAAPFFATGVFHWWSDVLDMPCNQALGGCVGFEFNYGGAIATAALTPILISNTNNASYYTGAGAASLPNYVMHISGALHNGIAVDASIDGGAEYVINDSWNSAYTYNAWFYAETGDAVFNEKNGTSGIVNGLWPGNKRLDFASLNVRMGADGSTNVVGQYAFDLEVSQHQLSIGVPTIISAFAGGNSRAALEVTNTDTSTINNVAHFHTSTHNGYVISDAPVQLGQYLTTGTSGNTDLAGELTFSSSTSATYFWADIPAVHPEVYLTNQMDIGSGNRCWVTYSGVASFTINCASPVTGSISYLATWRN